MPLERRYVLTLSCPDTTGIVARIAGFLAGAGGWIVEHLPGVETGPGYTQAAVESVFPGFGAGFIAVAITFLRRAMPAS